MSETPTPRTDAAMSARLLADNSRQLERELAAAQKEIERLKAEIPEIYDEGAFDERNKFMSDKPHTYEFSRAKRIAEGKE